MTKMYSYISQVAFLNKEQQSNQTVPHVTEKDTKENKVPESVSYGCS